jgi:hypothetical protein
MSQPVPDPDKQPSVIAVPAYVTSVVFGGGCGVSHVPVNGAVDCAVCFPYAQGFIYPPDPDAAAPAQEQPVANADVQPSPPTAVDASAPVAAAPAPDAPAPKSKKSTDDGPSPA